MKKIIPLLFIYFPLVLLSQNSTQIGYYQKVISYLASDSLEGRLSGTPGELMSAKFIKQEMKDLGLSSGTNKDFLQTFEFNYLRIPTNKNLMYISYSDSSKKLYYGKDFTLISPTCNNGRLSTVPFYAGHGITIKTHDDYKNFDHKADSGKVFIIKLGHPENGKSHSNFDGSATMQSKIALAIAKGAGGIVFINNEGLEAPSGSLKPNGFISDIPIIYLINPVVKPEELVQLGMDVEVAVIKREAHNVIGIKQRNKRKKYLVIGAHHDHLGRAEMGNSRAQGQEIHNGADDNASGVAMMLHMAKTLPNKRVFRKYNLIFVAFSAEELGLLGSKYFINNCPIDTSQILAMINFDMVGRLNSTNHTAVINGIGTSPYWTKRHKKLKTDTSELIVNSTNGGVGSSDHTSFYLANIPAVHLFSGQHREYHMPEDDIELINYEGMALLEDYATKFICKYPKKRRNFTPTESNISGISSFKVTLGVMPDYTFSEKGLRLDNVSEGKTAAKAGLQRNDVILKIGTFDIATIEDYMNALTQFNKKDQTTVQVLRNGETLIKTITFQ